MLICQLFCLTLFSIFSIYIRTQYLKVNKQELLYNKFLKRGTLKYEFYFHTSVPIYRPLRRNHWFLVLSWVWFEFRVAVATARVNVPIYDSFSWFFRLACLLFYLISSWLVIAFKEWSLNSKFPHSSVFAIFSLCNDPIQTIREVYRNLHFQIHRKTENPHLVHTDGYYLQYLS